jgi:hypothetical protein
MAHDIAAIETKLRAIERSVGTLTEGRYVQQLLPIIKQPGWTSIAEAMLVNALLDQMQNQIEALHRSCETLLAAAKKVGTK